MTGRTIVYVAQTMTNPGVAGAAEGVREAARVIGWNVRVIDGGGTPAGIQAAMSEAVTLRPSGIVIGGFDPEATSQQIARAEQAGIPLIGWHAVAAPGPSRMPRPVHQRHHPGRGRGRDQRAMDHLDLRR